MPTHPAHGKLRNVEFQASLNSGVKVCLRSYTHWAKGENSQVIVCSLLDEEDRISCHHSRSGTAAQLPPSCQRAESGWIVTSSDDETTWLCGLESPARCQGAPTSHSEIQFVLAMPSGICQRLWSARRRTLDFMGWQPKHLEMDVNQRRKPSSIFCAMYIFCLWSPEPRAQPSVREVKLWLVFVSTCHFVLGNGRT